MNDYTSLVQSFKCYEHVRVMDDMNNLECCELKSLDTMNRLRLWMIWTILYHELKPLDDMNNSRLWMIWMTLGHILKALNDMNNSEV